MAQYYTRPEIAFEAVRGMQIDPLESYGKVMSLKSMLTRQRGEELQNRQTQMQMQEEQLFRDAYTKTGGDLEKTAEVLLQSGASPDLVEYVRAGAAKRRNDLQTLDEGKRKKQGEFYELSGLMAARLRQTPPEQRQHFYELSRQALAQQYGPEAINGLPEEVPDDGTLDFYITMSKRGMEEVAAGVERPGKQAKSAEEQFGLAAQSLGASKGQAEWTAKRNFLSKRVDADIMAQIPEQYSPEAAMAVRQMGVAPPKEAPLSDFEAAFQRDKGRLPTTEELVAHKRDMARAGRTSISMGGGETNDLADMAQAVAEGQMEITAVPMKQRAAVVRIIRESGQVIVSAKERGDIQALDIPLGIIDDVAKYADKINTEQGLWARTTGAYRSLKAAAGYDPDVTALESKIGTLSLLIRALGEKGTLAEGDVQRALALIPKVPDTKTEKDNKLRDLRGILQNAKQVKLRGTTQTYPQGGTQPQTQPQTDPLGILK